MQDPIRGWEGQEVLVDNCSTSDSGVATMAAVGTSGTDTIPNSTDIFDLAVDCYGFDYTVFVEDNSDCVDFDVSDIVDNTNIEIDDEENA